MKKRYFFIAIIPLILTIGGLIIFGVTKRYQSNKVAVISMDDGKGVFVGKKALNPNFKRSSVIEPKLLQEQENHDNEIMAIHDSWAFARQGDVFFNNGQYDNAISSYKKALQASKGDESYFGMALIKAYEKMHRYDEALALLDEIESKYYKNEYGIQRAEEIRTRLTTAKGEFN